MRPCAVYSIEPLLTSNNISIKLLRKDVRGLATPCQRIAICSRSLARETDSARISHNEKMF